MQWAGLKDETQLIFNAKPKKPPPTSPPPTPANAPYKVQNFKCLFQ